MKFLTLNLPGMVETGQFVQAYKGDGLVTAR
jgi:hypothetical protein